MCKYLHLLHRLKNHLKMELTLIKYESGRHDINVEKIHTVAVVPNGAYVGFTQYHQDRLAALFVAAPDLLEALKRIADGFDGNNENEWRDIVNENREVARTAIAKAEPQPQNEQQ